MLIFVECAGKAGFIKPDGLFGLAAGQVSIGQFNTVCKGIGKAQLFFQLPDICPRSNYFWRIVGWFNETSFCVNYFAEQVIQTPDNRQKQQPKYPPAQRPAPVAMDTAKKRQPDNNV